MRRRVFVLSEDHVENTTLTKVREIKRLYPDRNLIIFGESTRPIQYDIPPVIASIPIESEISLIEGYLQLLNYFLSMKQDPHTIVLPVNGKTAVMAIKTCLTSDYFGINMRRTDAQIITQASELFEKVKKKFLRTCNAVEQTPELLFLKNGIQQLTYENINVPTFEPLFYSSYKLVDAAIVANVDRLNNTRTPEDIFCIIVGEGHEVNILHLLRREGIYDVRPFSNDETSESLNASHALDEIDGGKNTRKKYKNVGKKYKNIRKTLKKYKNKRKKYKKIKTLQQ